MEELPVQQPVEQNQSEEVTQNEETKSAESVQENQSFTNHEQEVKNEQTSEDVKEEFTEPTPLNIKYAAQEVAAPEVKEENIKDVLSRYQDKQEDILKELGYDEFAIGALKHYKATGNLNAYAEAASIDYNKMPDLSILERGLREKYAQAGIEGEDLDVVVEEELEGLKQRYILDPEVASEREVKAGLVRLKAEAAPFRKQFSERQKQFLSAPPKVDAAPQAEVQPDPKAQMEQYRQSVLSQKQVQDFAQSKTLKMGDYNFEVKNPHDAVAMLYDNQRYLYHTAAKNEKGQIQTDAQGHPVMDFQKLLKIAAYTQHMDAIEQALINHGKSMGTKDAFDQAENIKDHSTKASETESQSFWSSFARQARMVNG